MAVIKLTLTEDMLNLISHIGWGTEEDALYGCDLTFENIAYMIGRYNEHIPGTEENFEGVRFATELEDYMWDTHMSIINNLESIEELVHQFVNRGGLTPGTYKCKSNERIWTKVEE